MTSIGYTSLYGSVGGPLNLNLANGPPNSFLSSRGHSILGWGIQGFIPQALVTTNNESENTDPLETRFILINAWNTTYPQELAGTQYTKPAQTPFRVVNNSGDILSRQVYSCGGPCQTFQSRPRLHGLKQHFGHIQTQCDGTGIPPASCNTKYVYDSSDYIRFRKQVAIVRNYNILSNGNNNYSGSQVAYRAIRRY